MPTNLTTEDLDCLQEHYESLRALEQRATKGPWQTRFLFRSSTVARKYAFKEGLLLEGDHNSDWADAALTEAARNEFPGHVEMVLRMIARVRSCYPCRGSGRLNGAWAGEQDTCERCRTDREELSIVLAGLERAGRSKV